MSNRNSNYRQWIPNTVKALRTSAGLTQQQLAERCGLNAHSTIGQIESGKYIPPIETLDKILTVLGVTLVLGFEVDEEKLANDWIYVSKDTLRRIVEMVGEIDPDALQGE